MGVVLYSEIVHNTIKITTPCFHCTPLCRMQIRSGVGGPFIHLPPRSGSPMRLGFATNMSPMRLGSLLFRFVRIRLGHPLMFKELGADRKGGGNPTQNPGATAARTRLTATPVENLIDWRGSESHARIRSPSLDIRVHLRKASIPEFRSSARRSTGVDLNHVCK